MLTEVKAELAKRGLKQRDVARKLQIGDDRFSRYLSGKRSTPDHIKTKLAVMFKRKKSELFPG